MQGYKYHRPGQKKDEWTLMFDVDPIIDPVTGNKKRQQKSMVFRGNSTAADARLRELCGAVDKGCFIQPSKVTLVDYVLNYVRTLPKKRPGTTRKYLQVQRRMATSNLKGLLLQKVTAKHLQDYYASLMNPRTGKPLAESTKHIDHVLLHQVLQAAAQKDEVTRNVAALIPKEFRPKPDLEMLPKQISSKSLTAEQAVALQAVILTLEPQMRAFWWLAFETGLRKAEVCGLQWDDSVGVNLHHGRIAVVQQLRPPYDRAEHGMFGPTKSGKPRTMEISPELITLLMQHKQHQAEIKMRDRQHYRDHGLVFARESPSHLGQQPGDPLNMAGLRDQLHRLLEQADVKRISPHGLRHSCATLLLSNGEYTKVVQERLGHSKSQITLDLYAHTQQGMQKQASIRMSHILQGKKTGTTND